MLSAQEISYMHPDRTTLFQNISISVKKSDKAALIGSNGTGKSTLLKIFAGILQPSTGVVQYQSAPYYIPQHFGQFDDYTVAQALQVQNKLNALHEILTGNTSEKNWSLLNEDWTIEERCHEAFAYWELKNISLGQQLKTLSGGEKTKVFLSGMQIHEPDLVILDEPTNHLDSESRNILYNFIKVYEGTLVVTSHDRTLLELLTPVFELESHGITVYGGNYSFYKEQKSVKDHALLDHFENREKALKTAKRVKRESIERKQRQNARGKGKIEKENMPRIARKTMRNRAETTTAKLMKTHSEKIDSISEELKQIGKELPNILKIKLDFDNTSHHTGKTLIEAVNINFKYDKFLLWENPITFKIVSGERINIRGSNGSGKSTLIRLMLGDIKPFCGFLKRSDFSSVYVDQDYSIIKNELTIYEQAQQFNHTNLQEHDIKIRLNRFLFAKDFWNKECRTLSGGEKMRLVLCCLMISNRAPDMFILDEPTNNLDIQNIEILASSISEYNGTLIVVSHDSYFLKEMKMSRVIEI